MKYIILIAIAFISEAQAGPGGGGTWPEVVMHNVEVLEISDALVSFEPMKKPVVVSTESITATFFYEKETLDGGFLLKNYEDNTELKILPFNGQKEISDIDLNMQDDLIELHLRNKD